MEKKHIVSKMSPTPIGPYVHAVLYDYKYHLEISGQSGRDSKTGKLSDGILAQTEQTLQNIKTILSEVGWNFTNVIKVRIYLTDMKEYEKINKIYLKFFPNIFPSRAVVEVSGLPGGALIGMECLAGGNSIRNIEK